MIVFWRFTPSAHYRVCTNKRSETAMCMQCTHIFFIIKIRLEPLSIFLEFTVQIEQRQIHRGSTTTTKTKTTTKKTSTTRLIMFTTMTTTAAAIVVAVATATIYSEKEISQSRIFLALRTYLKRIITSNQCACIRNFLFFCFGCRPFATMFRSFCLLVLQTLL